MNPLAIKDTPETKRLLTEGVMAPIVQQFGDFKGDAPTLEPANEQAAMETMTVADEMILEGVRPDQAVQQALAIAEQAQLQLRRKRVPHRVAHDKGHVLRRGPRSVWIVHWS